jgi:hypothetical protein
LTGAALLALAQVAAMQPATRNANRGIQGVWYPHKLETPPPGAGWKLEVTPGNLSLSYTRIVNSASPNGIDIVMYNVAFREESAGREHRLVPVVAGMGVTQLRYHLEGDRLFIDEGTCGDGISLRGEWRHKAGER